MDKTSKIEPRTLKGFRDYGLIEQKARQDMLQKIQTTFERFGFAPLSTPSLEYKEILMNKYGDDEKLVYSFTDNGDREVALRYDLTVPLARFVAQNQGTLAFPFKRYQIAPVWRAENTQRGRSREFYQCDVDVVGTESLSSDAEVIACLCLALEAVGIKNYEARINNRQLFKIFLKKFQNDEKQIVTIIRGVDKLAKIGTEGVLQYLRDNGIDDEGIEEVRKFLGLQEAQNIFTEVKNQYEEGSEIVKSMNELMKAIMLLGVSADHLAFDPFIARGLDYYTGVVFEVVLKDKPEFGSITGGGRYDGLVDQYSSQSLPAVGGSIGIDRLFEVLESEHKVKSARVADCIILNLDESLRVEYLEMAKIIRTANINTEVYYDAAKLEKQFKYAEQKNIPYAVVVGKEEKEQGSVKIKNLQTREERVVQKSELASTLVNMLASNS